MKHSLIFITVLALTAFACTVELVTPTPTPTYSTTLPTVTAAPMATPTKLAQVLAEPTATDSPSVGTVSVTVTYDLVNIRFEDHSATGTTVKKGTVLAVIWSEDGYGEIVGSDLNGFYIWRGCTNDPGEYSCVTANR